MYGQKIRNIIQLLIMTALFLAFPHHLVQASGLPDTGDKNIVHQERNSQAKGRVTVLKAKNRKVMSVLNSLKSLTKPEERIEDKLSALGFKWSQSCLDEKRTFKDSKEAEGYLKCLLEERKILEGDFFGINITSYRYVNVFYPRGYIRSKIFEIDKEMKRTKSAIRDLEK